RSCRACADAARDERLRARHRSDSRLALGDLFAAVRVGHERLAGRSALRGRSDARRLARIERPRDAIEEARLQAAITEADPAHIAPILVAAGLALYPVEIHAAPGRRERDRRVVTGNHIEGTISFANDELFAKPGLASASSNECEPSVVGPPRP